MVIICLNLCQSSLPLGLLLLRLAYYPFYQTANLPMPVWVAVDPSSVCRLYTGRHQKVEPEPASCQMCALGTATLLVSLTLFYLKATTTVPADTEEDSQTTPHIS